MGAHGCIYKSSLPHAKFFVCIILDIEDYQHHERWPEIGRTFQSLTPSQESREPFKVSRLVDKVRNRENLSKAYT